MLTVGTTVRNAAGEVGVVTGISEVPGATAEDAPVAMVHVGVFVREDYVDATTVTPSD
jgi:hypothetical protein